MSWDFETDAEFQAELDWVEKFVSSEVEPLDFVIPAVQDLGDPVRQELIPPLQQLVKDRGLWGCHLSPELGGLGYGQVKLALLNEVLGRARCAPVVFGAQAPDTGNSEILAHYGTEEQRQRWLKPLLNNEIVSCFSMTEPQGGSDPQVFTTRAELDGDEWVLNGEKWFSTNARYATILIVMAVTEPNNARYERQSMLVVPTDAPGIEIVRNVGLAMDVDQSHGYLRFRDVRVPADHLLGPRGGAFVVAQTRLGGGRIHHAMRTIGLVRRSLDLMAERALSRSTQGERLADKQLVQAMVADSWLDLETFRLLVLQTAWKIDRYNDYKRVRGDISAVKALMPEVLNRVASRALQVHGSLGVSDEMPFMHYITEAHYLGLADGPTEVHRVTLGREVLKRYSSNEDLFPRYHLPRLRDAAIERHRDVLERYGRLKDPLLQHVNQ